MTNAAGDMINSAGLVVREVYSKVNTAITLGQCVVFDTNGFAPCATATSAGVKGYMALDTIAAVAATRVKFRIVLQGLCRVKKTTGGHALNQGATPTFVDGGGLQTGGNAPANIIVATDAVDADAYYEVWVN